MSEVTSWTTLSIDELIALKLVHEIHTSERRSYRSCRRRFDWIFRKNYYPYITAKPLEFGSAFHHAMEYYYEPATWKLPREVVAQFAIVKFVEKCEEQRAKFLKQQAVPYIDEDVQQDYNERVELGKGMLNYYFSEIASKQDVGWTPVKVEISFMVPIPHPDTKEQLWCNCDQCWERLKKYEAKLRTELEGLKQAKSQELSKLNASVKDRTAQVVTMQPIYNAFSRLDRNNWKGFPVVYAGRCDMLAIDSEGYYWIFDWKTALVVHVDHDEFLELDDQVMSYVWALRKLGIPIRGFVYHEQKKGYPQPPKQNKVRRLGCLFSVAKNQDTDYDTYLRTVSEEDKEAYEQGCYDEFLEYLKNEGIVFYKRWQIYKSDYQCERAEYDIGQEALEIIDPNTRIYPSPGRFGCTTCAFRQPCLSVNDGGDFQYALDTLYERREHYYVREEASTDSKGGE